MERIVKGKSTDTGEWVYGWYCEYPFGRWPLKPAIITVNHTPKYSEKEVKEMNLTDFAKEIHENARAHGWWDEERSFGEIIALCHSELSEALEAYRSGLSVDKVIYRFDDCGDMTKDECAGCYNGNPKCFHAKPDGVPVELADCIIRILDYCGQTGIEIEDVIRRKHGYNKTRPYRHGWKKL